MTFLGLGPEFWERVDMNGPEVRPGLGKCWLWMGGRCGGEYGAVSHRGRKQTKAHRMTLEGFLGRALGPKMYACHHCDNPPCVRPDHLFEGTAKENQADCIAKGRWLQGYEHRPLRGEQAHGARLTEVDIREILASAEPQKSLAIRYGVHPSHISKIRSRKKWRCLDMDQS